MSTRFKNSALLLMIPFFIIGVVLLVLIITVDYNDEIPRLPEAQRSSFNLASHLTGLNQNNFKEKFPYDTYLDSADWHNVNSIRKDLSIMDSVSLDQILSQEVFSIALTEKMQERIQSSFVSYNPDSLILLIQWVERFPCYRELDRDNKRFYNSVYRYWMSFIIKSVEKYYARSYLVKYDYKFKYVISRCDEKSFTSSIDKNRLEKVIDNVIEHNWCYLLNRFWIGTTVLFKLIIFSLLLITFYGYICIMKIHLKSKKT